MNDKTSDAKREALRQKRRAKAMAAKLRRQEARAALREKLRQREIPVGAPDCPPVDVTRIVAFDTERAGFVEDDFIEIGAVRVDLAAGTVEEFHPTQPPCGSDDRIHPRGPQGTGAATGRVAPICALCRRCRSRWSRHR